MLAALRAYLHRALEPSTRITDKITRERSRFIIIILVLMTLMGVFITLVTGLSMWSYAGQIGATPFFAAIFMLFSAVLYVLARRGHHELAIRAMVGGTIVIITIGALPRPPALERNLLLGTLLVLPVAIAMHLLPRRQGLAAMLLAMGGVALLASQHDPIYHSVLLLGLNGMIIVLAIMALYFQSYYQVIRDERRQELTEKNAIFSVIEAYSEDAILIIDPDLTFRYASPSAGRVFGVSTQDIIGGSMLSAGWMKLMPIGTALSRMDAAAANIQAGRDDITVIAFDRPGTGTAWLECTTRPILTPEGGIDGVVMIVRDVTTRKLAEDTLNEERNLLRALIEHLPDGVYVLNKDNVPLVSNGYAKRLFSYLLNGPQIVENNSSWMASLSAEMQKDALEEHARVLAGETIHDREIVLKDTAGQTRFIASTKIPLRDSTGRIRGLIGQVRDVTQEKSDQQIALFRAREQAQMSVDLQKEREMNQLKTLFMNLVSHEFRTPLAKMRTAMDMLDRYGDRLDGTARAERYNTITGQIDVLKGMLDDITTVLQLQSGSNLLTPQITHLAEFCQQIADDAANNRGAGRIQIVTSGRIEQVVIDQRMLRYIVRNLVSNALKYSAESSPVLIEIGRTMDEAGDQITLSVEDRGIGMTRGEQARLFEPFYRSDNVHHIPGTGLGLRIVADCVAVLRGTITVDSTPGEGTRFTVTLPVSGGMSAAGAR